MSDKTTREQEIIAAHIAATTTAFQLLVLCLQENEALRPGQFETALAELIAGYKPGSGKDTVFEMLNDLKLALSN
jgi:hypothetical protein